MSPESESRVGIVMGVLALVSSAWIPGYAQALTAEAPLQLHEAHTSHATPYSPIANEEAQGCMKGTEVDGIVAEYVSSGLEEPQCGDLVNGGGSENFPFEQFTPTDSRTPPGHEHEWAWLRRTLLEGLEYTYKRYKAEMRLNSGYRCPTKNAAVGGKSKSRHMFGDAVDVRATPAQQEAIIQVTNATFYLRYSTYIHLDWRPIK